MASTLPTVPKIAQDAAYPAGAQPWSGGLTKLPATSGGFISVGWTPDTPPGAQEENRFRYDDTEALRDLQIRALPRFLLHSFADQVGSRLMYLPLTGLIIITNGTGLKGMYGSRTPNTNLKREVAVGGGVDLNGTKGATYRSGATSKIAFMPFDAAGTTAALDVWTDAATPVHSYGTLPQAGANYTHGCQDVDTGRAVFVAGNSALAANAGFASGDPDALTFAAAGAGVAWAADPLMSCASKPGEVRAFSKTITFASADGGVTVGNLVATVWSGGAPTGNMFPPVWDAKNSRWICAVTHQSTSAAIAILHSTIWTSTDGVTWTKLADSPASVSAMHIEYHSGVLFAIARMINPGSPAVYHGGLEILFSLDGGETWKRPGIDLSITDPGYGATVASVYHHTCGFTKCGSVLYAHAGVKVGAINPGALIAGEGMEYVALAVHGDDAESL